MKHQNKKGMAITISIIFASVLTLFVVSYAQMVRQSKPQTVLIDDRIKLDYLARGLCELAMLKFQKFSVYYFACCDAVKLAPSDNGLKQKTIDVFTGRELLDFPGSGSLLPSSSFSQKNMKLQLTNMKLITNERYKDAALYMSILGTYELPQANDDSKTVTKSKTVIKIVKLNRKVLSL